MDSQALLDVLLEKGSLGVFATLSLLGVWKLYRDLRREQAAAKSALKALADEWQARLDRQQQEAKLAAEEWQRRLIEKSERWMEKYHELAHSLRELVEALDRRRRGSKG